MTPAPTTASARKATASHALVPVLFLAPVLAFAPGDSDREEARRRAAEELSRSEYDAARPNLVVRGLEWLWEQLSDALSTAGTVGVGTWAGLLLVMLVLVVVVVAVRRTAGRTARSRALDASLFVGGTRSSEEHRRVADAHAAAGRWAEAVRERLRAVVRSLEERVILLPGPGRTAREAAAEAGRSLPQCAGDLRAAAERSDAIWFGGSPAGAADDAQLRDLDRLVRSERPGPGAPGASATTFAVAPQ